MRRYVYLGVLVVAVGLLYSFTTWRGQGDTVSFHLRLNDAQLIVMDAARPQLIRWNPATDRQGFSWTPSSTAFRLLPNRIDANIRVQLADVTELPPGAVRAIAVPFMVQGTEVEIGSSTGRRRVPVPPGSYELLFAATPGGLNGTATYDLLFAHNDQPSARILRSDPAISPPAQLLFE